METKGAPDDLLRRFTPTPLVADLRVMDRTIRLETNSPTILEHTRRALECYGGTPSGQPEFLWKLVSEADPELKPPWPEITAFSHEGLYLVNVGQRSFLAIDLEAKEAVGFLSEALSKDELGFSRPFLAMLFSITAEALQLTALSTACVALGEKGLLIFGPPKSGKTTSSYLAGKLGLEFHADHVAFLEFEGSGLRAWGEFWPAVFHLETQAFLPELSDITREFYCRNLTFLYLEKSPLRASEAHGVIPVSCIFLERQTAEVPQLTPLGRVEFAVRLKESCLFQDDEPERAAIVRALGDLPAYRLAYGSDPTAAAIFFRSLLSSHSLLEAKP